MSQCFAFINVDTGQTSGSVGKWPPLNACRIASWISTCERPLPLQDFLKRNKKFLPQRPTDGKHLGELSVLPPEVIALLFQAMDNLELVMFAITNSQLFAIGYTDFVSRVAQFNAPWAHSRIILVGDDSLEFPQHLLSEDELDALDDIAGGDEDGLYTIADEAFEHMPQRQFLDEESFSPLENAHYPHDNDNAMRLFYASSSKSLFTHSSPRVLINTSVKEYIRETCDTSFDDILPLLTAFGYADADFCEGKPWLGSQRGRWAGYRLAIVPEEDHQKTMQMDEDPWRDITNWIARVSDPVIRENRPLVAPYTGTRIRWTEKAFFKPSANDAA